MPSYVSIRRQAQRFSCLCFIVLVCYVVILTNIFSYTLFIELTSNKTFSISHTYSLIKCKESTEPQAFFIFTSILEAFIAAAFVITIAFLLYYFWKKNNLRAYHIYMLTGLAIISTSIVIFLNNIVELCNMSGLLKTIFPILRAFCFSFVCITTLILLGYLIYKKIQTRSPIEEQVEMVTMNPRQ